MDVTRARIMIVIALGLLLAVGAGGAFDEFVWTLLVPVVSVGGAALVVSGRRLMLRVLVSTVAVVVGVGGAVLLGGGTFTDIGDAFVRGPRQLLTTEWPSPTVASVVGVVATLVAVVVAVGMDLAGRPGLHLAPLAALAVGWVAILAIGAPVRPDVWLFVAVGALSLLLALIRHDTDRQRSRQFLLADRTVLVSVVAIAVATLATATVVAWDDRADPRRTDDADVNAAVLDPIEASIALRRANPSVELFTITDRSRLVGQSLPARWRIAALSEYDGTRWVPRLTLRPIGGRLGPGGAIDPERPPPIRYDLEFNSDDLDLLPFPGAPIAVDVDVETDLERVVVRMLEPPVTGDHVVVDSEVALTSRSNLVGPVATRQVDDLSATFTDDAERLVDGDTAVERLRALEATMRDDWQLDSSGSAGGQQLALLERFVETERGTAEQFVSAFVLMARSLGYDARVATGFIVGPGVLQMPLDLVSGMAAVWPEVRMDERGWVAFDPVPVSADANEVALQPPPDEQTPAAAQPPIPPPVDEGEEPDDEVVEETDGSGRWSTVRSALVRAGVVAGLGLLPVLLAVGSIIGLKWRRRRRRIRQHDPVLRIRGAWANATDSLVDAGLAIPPSWTDDRIAVQAAWLAPSMPHELRRLAALSSQVTFGSSRRSDDLAGDAVSTSYAVDAAIRSARSRWQRLRWRLSLRSLRRGTRSPVTAGR